MHNDKIARKLNCFMTSWLILWKQFCNSITSLSKINLWFPIFLIPSAILYLASKSYPFSIHNQNLFLYLLTQTPSQITYISTQWKKKIRKKKTLKQKICLFGKLLSRPFLLLEYSSCLYLLTFYSYSTVQLKICNW